MPPRRKAAAVVKQEEESSDDSVPQPPTSRGGRASRTVASTSSVTGNKQAASTSSRARSARSTRGKKNVVESEEESEEEEVEGDKQDQEEEAQHVQPVAKKATTGGRRAETRRSTNSTTSASGSSKATTGSKTRTSRQSAKVEKMPDEEEAADDHFDVEEEDVKPTIPAKRAAAAPAQGRGKKVAPSIVSDEASEAEQELVESVEEDEAEAEEVGSENEVEADEATLPAAAQAQALDEPVVEGAVKDADEDGEEATQRPPPSQASRSSATPAPTAYDLAAQARAAALNHAALEKQREKEREGKPRLVIHQLVLEDFKSYRGRGVIGPFHKSFSSIVGPNGSGKSNTIDALLFVFGYRATKMRQGKLSELIHNSGVVVPEESSTNPLAPTQDEADGVEYEDDESDDDGSLGKKKGGKKGKGKKKDANYGAAQEGLIGSCTVEVWFREIIDLPGRDDFTVVPNSQLIVARTAYRNNSSRYTINGKVSSFTEVQTLLKARGIDLDHKRFLILQGEVESIAQMKPKGATEHDEGLLEYLEDIIGTSKYKPEIEAANVEVERLNDARGIQLNRVKLVEREKGALESRKKECDSYLRDQNELVHNNSALFQVNIHQASYNAEIHTAELQEAQSGFNAELEDQTGTKEEVEALQHEYNEMVKDCKDTEKATAEIVKHLAVLDRADVQRQEKKKSMVTKVKKLKKVLEEEGHLRSEAETWVKNHSDTITRVGGEMEKMESLLEKEELELEKVRDSLKGKTEVFSAQIETLQTELQPWAEQIGAKQAAINLAQNERDMLVEKGDTVRIAIEEAEASIHKLRSDDETKSGRLAELKAEKAEVEAQIAKAQSDINAMQSRDAKLRERATAARQRSDEAKASQSASRSQGDTLATLTKLKDQGRLPGFHGRLGNLGRIDDKFDVAVSTACGGLDNIITDTVVVAQQCIDVVRKNQLGRVNVMALEKIKARQMDKIATPENVPRLFDLITPKEARFAPCFFQLLQNTLVANDLEQGKRIAYGKQRWRVVTLDGQLFETTGTMSGGGGRPARGKMSSKIVADEFTPEVVARCEKEREASSEALRVFTEDRSKAERELSTLRKRLPEVDMAIDKIKMDVKASDKRIAEATARLKELKTQSKPEAGDLKKIEQLDKEIASLSMDLENLKSETKGIETQITALQNKILEVGGVRLRGQQTKVQDLKSQIDLANERLTKAEVGKAKSEKDAAKLTKSIGANQKGLEAAQQELEELVQQMQGGDEEVSAVRDAVAKAQAVLESKTDELAEMKRTLDAQIEIMTQFRKREMELKQQVDQHTKLLKEANNAIEYWSEKVANLVLNEINEDDDDDEEGEAGEGAVREKPPRPETELHQYSDEEIAELDVKVLKAKISALEERIARSTLDLSVLKEYARREKEFMQRAADLDAVTKERDAAKQLADDLRSQRLREFMGGFGIISMKLKEMYQMITLGGNAELELVDSLDPFSEGIIFSVMPPKKSWKNISNLSGGEKTLSSLALVFALHVFKPTPLYFMDEIDAALDFRNVSIVANYIKDRTKNAQFIIISLRNNMFELSSRLIGIYKVANQTRSVAIDNKELAQIQMVPATA